MPGAPAACGGLGFITSVIVGFLRSLPSSVDSGTPTTYLDSGLRRNDNSQLVWLVHQAVHLARDTNCRISQAG